MILRTPIPRRESAKGMYLVSKKDPAVSRILDTGARMSRILFSFSGLVDTTQLKKKKRKRRKKLLTGSYGELKFEIFIHG